MHVISFFSPQKQNRINIVRFHLSTTHSKTQRSDGRILSLYFQSQHDLILTAGRTKKGKQKRKRRKIETFLLLHYEEVFFYTSSAVLYSSMYCIQFTRYNNICTMR